MEKEKPSTVHLVWKNVHGEWVDKPNLATKQLKFFVNWLQEQKMEYRYEFISGITYVGKYKESENHE